MCKNITNDNLVERKKKAKNQKEKRKKEMKVKLGNIQAEGYERSKKKKDGHSVG